MLINNNCTNIFSQSVDIYILLVEQVTTDSDAPGGLLWAFRLWFLALQDVEVLFYLVAQHSIHFLQLNHAYGFMGTPGWYCATACTYHSSNLQNTSMKGNFVVISAVLVVEKYFFLLSLFGSELFVLGHPVLCCLGYANGPRSCFHRWWSH